MTSDQSAYPALGPGRPPFPFPARSAMPWGVGLRGALAALLAAVCSPAAAQINFSDHFNRGSLTTGAPAAYTTSVTAGDGGAGIVAGSFLQLTNDATAAPNGAGRVFVTAPTAGYGSWYNATLSANAVTAIEWTVNLRYAPQGQAGGFGNGKPSLAVVLGATSADLTTAGGYAVTIGHNGQSDRIQLERFAGGLVADANLTTVVATGTANLAGASDYASVRVRYEPATSLWRLYVRDDGSTGWVDPSAGVTTLTGSATDSTYTNLALGSFGFYSGYGSAGTQLGQFDNYEVTAYVTPAPEPGTVFGLGALGLGTTALGRRLRRGRSTA